MTVNGNVDLLDGVFLTQLGASLTVNPPPTTISGSATVSFGPQVSGTSVLSLAGTLTRVFKSGTAAGSYAVDGAVAALAGSSHSLVLGTLSGNLKADNTGIASCAKTSGGTQVGFKYYWSTGAIDVFDSKGCSEQGF
ncbi:MAG: hypothetical protein ACRDVW_07070 [Acidimicrobiales bacterium]